MVFFYSGKLVIPAAGQVEFPQVALWADLKSKRSAWVWETCFCRAKPKLYSSAIFLML